MAGYGDILPVNAQGLPQKPNDGSSSDPNTALLQKLVTRLAPDPVLRLGIQFTGTGAGTSGVINALYIQGMNNQLVNGFINSLVSGTVYVYLNGLPVTDFVNPPPPDLVFTGGSNGSDQIHLPPFNPQAISFYNKTAVFGSIQIIGY